MRRNTRIRPSQFILTYGPGAILEGEKKNRPRIILDAGLGLFNEEDGIKPSTYRIGDDGMSRWLGGSIYRLPTASELPDLESYATKMFPEWSLCVRPHGPGNDYLLHKGADCMLCGSQSGAIRFVLACRDGHLDDVHWDYGVHRGSKCSGDNANHRARSGLAFYWQRAGGTLRDITLKCPNCEAYENLGTMYYNTHKCSARHPHREKGRPLRSRDCQQAARIVARQSSSLRIAETETLLTIRPVYTNIHRMLQDPSITSALATARELSGEINEVIFRKIMEVQAKRGFIPYTKLHKILLADWETIQDALEFVENPPGETYPERIKDEFKALLAASESGAPPQMFKRRQESTATGLPPEIRFEANLNHIRPIKVKNTEFRVMPIQTLRTVTVQKGFYREVSGGDDVSLPETTDVSFLRGEKRWYPGVEYMGEGIFIRLESGDGWGDAPSGDESDRWLEEFCNHDRAKYPEHVFRDPLDRAEIHPGFVWWHTLAHALVRTIGTDSGFSSAAIRERVYFERGQGGRVRGGILLYATQPGNEGTMGGLIGTAPRMETIMVHSLDACRSCSSDPLCSDTKFERGRYNGASCYACTLNPETSCEHRNMWLDRNVLNSNSP